MSFQPVFEITRILSDSSELFIKDKTPNGGPTGYGTSGNPANVAAITAISLSTKAYGENFVKATQDIAYSLADLGTEIGFKGSIPDGVVITEASYGVQKNLFIVVSSDRMVLTITYASTLLDGVTYISIAGSDLIQIDSIAGDTVLLHAPLPGSMGSYAELTAYYSAQVRSLVLYRANACIAREVEKISLYDSNQDMRKPILKVMLKEAAQREYTLGNYSKADEATRLICGTQPYYTLNCNTCE